MKALIDSDYFAYAHGSTTNDEGHPLAWPLVASRISQQIENIVHASGCEDYELFLTGKGNFRESVATIRPYKGNRTSDKPYHYERVREYLIKFRGATLIEGMEADDAVSIEQYTAIQMAVQNALGGHAYTETIICSLDKDLDNTPGWHYNWVKDRKYYVEELGALQSFYCQLLTGDTVDNIPGLFGVGKASTLLRKVRDCSTEIGMYEIVREQYEKRFGSYWEKFLTENAILLWMLREEGEIHYGMHEAELRLECLEEQRNEQGVQPQAAEEETGSRS